MVGGMEKKTTACLSEDLRHELQNAAGREGRPQSELAREALTAYPRDWPRTRPRSIGVLDDVELCSEDEEALGP
jgi:hypothetical protein